jgi:nitrite reductase/ring-hydroxylating ferredoxin subunit
MNRPDQEAQSVAPDGRPEALQPDWRRAFPIDKAQDNYLARRDFTKFMGLTSLAFVVGQAWIAVQSWLRQRRGAPPILKIARLEEIPVGGALLFQYPEANDTCLLLRPSAQTLLAYNQKCTHLSCAVVPELDKGLLHCPCHHGVFAAGTGQPLSGPPRRPLARITVEVRGDAVYATGVELRTV